MIAYTIVIGLAAGVLLLPVVSDILSLIYAGLRRSERPVPPGAGPQPRFVFLVPAHDEELLIGECLRSLSMMRYPEDRLRVVVVADNCSDGTARIALQAGVSCLERNDSARRGKPWAIAWALKQLPLSSYDGVVIVDADSVVDAGFASGLASVGPIAECAAQCYNDVSNRTESALTLMGATFSAVRFKLLNPLKQRAGLNVPLANGLCIGTRVIAVHGWQAFSICEDWEMYGILTASGVRIKSAPDARIFSQEAKSLRQSASQRRRWTAGRRAVLLRQGLQILRSQRPSARQKLDAIAELTTPGPVVHFAAAIALLALCFVFRPLAFNWIILGLSAALARPVVYTILAIFREPDPISTMRAFTFLPFYMVWRLGIQLSSQFMVGEKPWVRTKRHVHSKFEVL